MARCVLSVALGAAASGAGCSDDQEPVDDGARTADVVGLFAPAGGELADTTFFDHPFPSDLRRDEAGKVVVAGWPLGKAQLLELYVAAIDRKLDGFSPLAAGFLRFSGALDVASLPQDPGASVEASSSVQLIDVDPASPEHGTRRPILVGFRPEEGIYFPSNLLRWAPAVGFPLRPRTRYALVVTDDVGGDAGSSVGPSIELSAAIERGGAWESIAAELTTAGIPSSRVVHLAAFTTNDPTEELARAAAALPAQIVAPTARAADWRIIDEEDEDFVELGGLYGPSPNYQEGTSPFAEYGDGGGFALDADGVPQVQSTFDLRFSLTVPRPEACPVPAGGYPIALYAHGTGGDYRSYRQDGTARALAQRCVAAMGVDQIFHGTRDGSEGSTELLFFNFQNPDAARTNIRQSAIDELQRERLITGGGLAVPSALSPTGDAIGFDAAKISFFGHSQGALNGPLYLAMSSQARGGVLSGASSIITITLLEKTEPKPSVAALVKGVFLGLTAAEEGEVDLFHPALSLAQIIEDAIDPIHYARLLAREAPERPKSVLLTEGISPDGVGDSYAPPRGCEALAMAIGVPIQETVVRFPPDAAWGGLERVTIPTVGLSGNMADGAASGVLAQWVPAAGSDGHFVVFDVEPARARAAQFIRNLGDEAAGRVPPP